MNIVNGIYDFRNTEAFSSIDFFEYPFLESKNSIKFAQVFIKPQSSDGTPTGEMPVTLRELRIHKHIFFKKVVLKHLYILEENACVWIFFTQCCRLKTAFQFIST